MAATELEIKVVTPRAEVIDETVDAVTLPGLTGELTVYPRHRPLLTSLRPGRFVLSGGSGEQVYYLAGGFAEILPGKIVVLADECIPVGEIDADAATNALSDARQALEERKRESVEELEQELLALRRAEVQVALSNAAH